MTAFARIIQQGLIGSLVVLLSRTRRELVLSHSFHVDSGGLLRWRYCFPGHSTSTPLKLLNFMSHVHSGGALRWRYCFPGHGTSTSL